MIRGEYLSKTEEELNTFKEPSGDPLKDIQDYDETEDFRRYCVNEGFHLTHIYPMYYQGWECDPWGAIGTKDGKRYRLETNHGGLCPVEIESGFPVIKSLLSLFFGDE